MTKRSQDVGRLGEYKTLQAYISNGYKLIKQNYQYYVKGQKGRVGEIDLIMLSPDDYMVFVEVKSRSNRKLGHVLGQISEKKINSLSLASQNFIYNIRNDFENFLLLQNINKEIFENLKIENLNYRFDLAILQGNNMQIIKNFLS